MSNAASAPLFRREALEHAATRGFGQVLLLSGPLRSVLTLLFIGIAAAIALFIALGSYTRSVAVGGVLLPADGVRRVSSASGGVVQSIHVREGQEVAAGDLLLTMTGLRGSRGSQNTDALISTLLRTRAADLAMEQGQLTTQTRQRSQATLDRWRALEQEIAQLQSQQLLQQQREQLAGENLRRYQLLAASGHVAATQVRDREAEFLEQQQRSAELQRGSLAIARQMQAAQSEREELQLQAARERNALERSRSQLLQELTEAESRAEWQIRAPAAGVISALSLRAGQTAMPGQTLLSLFSPEAPLVAELYAPSLAVGLLRQGQAVRLRFQAFPFQKFGQFRGSVEYISGNALQSAEIEPEFSAIAGRNPESLYKVRVKLEQRRVTVKGEPLSLRPGSLVDASIRVDTRRLYEWMFSPLISLRQLS